jgi:hypothetical protein
MVSREFTVSYVDYIDTNNTCNAIVLNNGAIEPFMSEPTFCNATHVDPKTGRATFRGSLCQRAALDATFYPIPELYQGKTMVAETRCSDIGIDGIVDGAFTVPSPLGDIAYQAIFPTDIIVDQVIADIYRTYTPTEVTCRVDSTRCNSFQVRLSSTIAILSAAIPGLLALIRYLNSRPSVLAHFQAAANDKLVHGDMSYDDDDDDGIGSSSRSQSADNHWKQQRMDSLQYGIAIGQEAATVTATRQATVTAAAATNSESTMPLLHEQQL